MERSAPVSLGSLMLVLISDANVLIDLEVGRIIERVFRLNATVAVPDVLFVEELAAQHAGLVAQGLQVRPLTAEALIQVMTWQMLYPKPSRNDLIAFALARQEGGILLTGDRDLRQAIESERNRPDGAPVEIHGTFWLIEQMLTDGVISDAEAKAAVERMKQGKRRLPWDRFDDLMRRRTRRTP